MVLSRNSVKDTTSDKKWVVVQLSSNAEKEKNLGVFSKSVRRYLGKELVVFVPAANLSARDDNHVMFYLDGYIFIEHVPGVNYNKLNDTAYFSNVLSHPKTGLCLVADSEIDTIRKGVEIMKVGSFQKNDEVMIMRGSYKNLTGKVSMVYSGGDIVQVDFGLKSKPLLLDYPANYLKKI